MGERRGAGVCVMEGWGEAVVTLQESCKGTRVDEEGGMVRE